jgi:Zn-dependent M32 family carboxypeptidase
MAGLENLASAPGDAPILEESSRKADERVFAAFELARNAIAAQNEIVDACHNAVLAEAKARKAAFFSKTPNLGEVVSMLMETVRSKWAETRMTTLWPNGAEPSNAEEQHTALFPSVKAKIELLARKILEEIEKPESSEREAQETPEQSENGQGDEIKLEYSISVLKTSSGVEVKLIKGDSAVFERTVDSKFAPFDSVMREVSRKLGKELMSLP